MSDFDRMVQQFTVKESNTIKKVCEPLHQILGIKQFLYCETNEEGVHLNLSSHPELHEYFYTSKFHLQSPFYCNPDLVLPGFYSYYAIDNENYKDAIASSSSKLHLSFAGSLVIKNKSSLIRFGYAFDKSIGRNATDIVLNNLPILNKFNNYFIKEMKVLIQKARNDGVYLPNEMGEIYQRIPKGLGKIFTTQQRCQFLEKIGCIKGEDVTKLTPRELECLRYLYEGYSAREIGKHLYISPRTVEKHIESVKNKLSCFTKSDIAYQAHMLHLAGFF